MKRLFLLDYFRGPDSTGLAAIRSNGDARVAKIAGNPVELFDMGRFKEALNGNASRAFIGHNRAATRGGVTSANAHPFHVDHIVGAHNGTIDSFSVSRLEKALGEKFAVDSQALFTAIARLGVDEAIGMCSDDDDEGFGASAWSLTWFDQNTGKLCFLRNKKRPMNYAFTSDFKRMFWASEWPMIQHAVQMAEGGYDLYVEPDTGFRYRTTEPNVLYEYDLADLRNGSGGKRPKPKAREVRGFPVVKTPYNAGGHSGNSSDPFLRRQPNVAGPPLAHPSTTSKTTTGGQSGSRTKEKKQRPLLTSSSNSSSSQSGKPLEFEATPEFPLANIISPAQFRRIAHQGCAWCSDPVEITEEGLVVFERDEIVLCPKHGGVPKTRVYIKNDLYL